MKTCVTCRVEKPHEDFHRSGAIDGRQSRCKPCANAYATEWNRTHRERHKLSVLRYRMRKRYGISLEEYEALLAKCEGRCPICRRQRPLVLDHDHRTGRVRGFLCSQCNSVLGMVDDDANTLIALAAYLARFSERT